MDIRIIDFQLCRYGSVVSDLAYLLYSGGTKEIFRQFDYYLRMYHDSFSSTLRDFGLDASKIFTFDDLKNEWRDNCAFGFAFSQMMWFSKLAKSYEKRNLLAVSEVKTLGGVYDVDKEIAAKYDIDTSRLKEILVALAEHLYDNDYL